MKHHDQRVLTRSIFVGAKIPLQNDYLSTELIGKQERE